MISPYSYPGIRGIDCKPLDHNDIIDIVVNVTGVEIDMIMLRKCRKPHVVAARYLCWKYIRANNNEVTHKTIGILFGGFHYSTVMYSFDALDATIRTDDSVKEMDERIAKLLTDVRKIQYLRACAA